MRPRSRARSIIFGFQMICVRSVVWLFSGFEELQGVDADGGGAAGGYGSLAPALPTSAVQKQVGGKDGKAPAWKPKPVPLDEERACPRARCCPRVSRAQQPRADAPAHPRRPPLRSRCAPQACRSTGSTTRASGWRRWLSAST
jgi:hypothetical protein